MLLLLLLLAQSCPHEYFNKKCEQTAGKLRPHAEHSVAAVGSVSPAHTHTAALPRGDSISVLALALALGSGVKLRASR
ncbi:UNVERIFIED_CONTAM: hypothetical protein FKN15_057809 [Acipenser sinensis]